MLGPRWYFQPAYEQALGNLDKIENTLSTE